MSPCPFEGIAPLVDRTPPRQARWPAAPGGESGGVALLTITEDRIVAIDLILGPARLRMFVADGRSSA
jgi:hypothetical protein